MLSPGQESLIWAGTTCLFPNLIKAPVSDTSTHIPSALPFGIHVNRHGTQIFRRGDFQSAPAMSSISPPSRKSFADSPSWFRFQREERQSLAAAARRRPLASGFFQHNRRSPA
jgi:hypothetical protein